MNFRIDLGNLPDIDFVPHMEAVARTLLGEPNRQQSSRTELRFGTHGSLRVDLEKGIFWDYEANAGGGVIDLICRETGQTPAGAFEWLETNIIGKPAPRPAPKPGRGQKLRILETYRYEDETGAHLFDVVRFEPKDFRQRAADGSWTVKDIRKVLYRLPQIAAADDGAFVYICEGEKDVHTLEAIGLLATTCPGGAGKWRDEYSASLTGKTCIILPDNDQAGRDHEKQVAQSLRTAGIRYAVVNLDGLPEKGDVSDWLGQGHEADDLRKLAERALEDPEDAPGDNGNKSPPLPDWPEPDARLLRPELPPAPPLDLNAVLKPRLAQWIKDAAQSKGAPVDYVLVSVLSVVGATIGNSRWAAIWPGWAEPPVIWAMCVGLPSAGKSPAIDAAVHPLRKAERPLREAAAAEHAEWTERAELAKLAEATWKDTARAALKDGKTPPTRPEGCDAGPPPHIPRLVVNDGTIERLGAILARQPRGTLQMRDELAGWLEGMQRYSGGGSDRPFWLEAFGGRGFTVERMGREPLTIDRLTIGVLGGIQPDRLKTLLFKSDDDGLLARFLPIWPEPAPICRPRLQADEALLERALSRLLTLDLVTDESGDLRPWFIPFTDEARDLMDAFRLAVREWEGNASGLLLSFIGKLPGLVARLALVLAFLDWATEGGDAPHELTVEHVGGAAHLIEAYFLPMARRAYADAAAPKAERAARQLVEMIRANGWESFTSRDVMRAARAGLSTAADVNPALAALEEGDCIRAIEQPASPQGGRPPRVFLVNPAILGGTQ